MRFISALYGVFMSFLFYFILRRLFVRLRFSEKEVSLEKGLLLKRFSVMPLCAVVRTTTRQTPIMRLFRAKEVSLFTLGGKIKFYLPRDERLPFLPEYKQAALKPRFGELIFGAFIDTRALGGIFVFTAVLRKFTAIFGSEYFNRLVSVLTKTSEELEKALGFFSVTVPRVAVTLAVFVVGSWVFAYIRKLLRLSRFRVFRKGDTMFVKSGVITLYEHALVPNSTGGFYGAAAVRCETFTSILTNRAPLYLRGVMVLPCVRRRELAKALKVICGFKMPQNTILSQKRAFLGHIISPLSWFGVFAAALALVYSTGHSALMLKTVLYCGAIVELYAAALYLLYMCHSGIAFGAEYSSVSARRGLRLYTAVFPNDIAACAITSQSVFQLRSGLCNMKLSLVDSRKLTARQLPKRELHRRIPFRPRPRRAPPNL